MSRRQQLQSAEGILLEYPGYGIVQYASKSLPVGGERGFAPGCEWFVPTGANGVNTSPNTSLRYMNIGSNGFYTGLGNASNPTATWVESDPTSGNQSQFGQSLTSSGFMNASGNMYRTILTTSNGINPSATSALKIVDIYTLPANAFDVAGRGLQFSVWCNQGGTSAHTVQIQVVANPSNTGLPASGAGVTGKTDGTVTVTGGTVILDTGTSYAPTGTPTFGLQLQGQLFKTGANASNTQESMTTVIFPSAGLTHTVAWTNQTLTENVANVFAVCILGQATADIKYQGMEITGYN